MLPGARQSVPGADRTRGCERTSAWNHLRLAGLDLAKKERPRIYHDPSYGLIHSSLSFTETAFNNQAQKVNATRWSSAPISGFVCPH